MITSSFDPLIMKRLAFIRLLYQQGVDQSHLPEPLTFTSVLAFHDSVELFLVLAGEHLGATLPDHLQFMKYWTDLHPNKLAGGVDLSGKVGMDRLNRMRNGFKHAGTMPGLAAIEQARADVTVFLEDNTPKVFGIPFGGIDMADVVPDSATRNKIKAAVTANETGGRTEALALLVEGLDELFQDHVEPYSYPPSPFSFGKDLNQPLRENDIHAVLRQPDERSRHLPFRGAQELARQIHGVTEAVIAMQRALRVMSLGIDYSRYHRFQTLTPAVFSTLDGKRHIGVGPGYAPNQAEFDYCHQFVITVALRMADVEARMIPPSWQVGQTSR